MPVVQGLVCLLRTMGAIEGEGERVGLEGRLNGNSWPQPGHFQ